MAFLAIDFGGTQIRAAWFNESMQIVKHYKTATLAAESIDSVLARIVDAGRQVIPEGEQPKAIGLAAPGPMDVAAGVILSAETLPGWKNVAIAQYISSQLNGAKVYMNNDGNLGAMAEAYVGAGINADPVIYLTVSTGIGGGAVINGQLFTGWRGMAIEPGHMRFMHPDGNVYRLEELASGTALGVWAAKRLESNKRRKSTLRSLKVIDGRAVGEAALAGDKIAKEVVDEAANWLGFGLVNLIHLFNPQLILMGGSVMLLKDLILEPIRSVVRGNLLSPRFYHDDLIRISELDDNVCLYGAAYYARTQSIWNS